MKFKWPARSLVSRYSLIGITVFALGDPAKAEDTASNSLASILEHANTLYSERNFEAARQEFERAVELDRGSLSAWRGLGWSYWALGQKQRAYQIWRDIEQGFPNDLPTLLALAKASEQDGRRESAIDYFGRVLTITPNDPAARLGRARIFVAQGNFQSAEQDPREILKVEPANASAKSLLADALMGQGRYGEAEAILRPLTQADRVPANLRRLATSLAGLGRYEQAADDYRSSLRIEQDADTLSAWRNLGSSLRKQDQNQRAYAVWEDLLKDYPNDIPTLQAIGRSSEQDDLWQQGLENYAQMLKTAPGNEDAHLGRARIFTSQGEYSSAEREIRAILAQSPSDTEARFALVENLVATDRREEAQQVLRSLIEGDPHPKAKNLSRLGNVLVDLGRDEESVKYFKQSLQIEPDDAKSVIGLAHAYWNQHRYGEATELLHRYLAAHPDNDVARARLAEHEAAAGDWEQAAKELRLLMTKHPDESRWTMKLARLLHRNGQHQEAVQLATQVLDKEPGNINALGLLADNAVFAGDMESGIRWIQRLTTVSPTPERLNQLGNLRNKLGVQLVKEGKQEAANKLYEAAVQDFQHAAALDPIKSRTPIGLLESFRLQGRRNEALELGLKTHQNYPNAADIIQQIADVYWEQGNFSEARKMLELKKPFFPANIRLYQDIAKLSSYSGDRGRGFKILGQLLEKSKLPSVPVLLYHGVTVSDRQDTMPLQKFRDQMLALKQAGYTSITLPQLLAFLNGNTGVLPPKPFVITFDDARSDSFQNADPVLAETGFTATMFVPVGDVATHGAYTVVWPTLREMKATGRWDMQCHGTEAQHYVPTDAEGHLGRFMVNKKWLNEASRLETLDEFTVRLDGDYRTCREAMSRELPDSNIFAYAFPYGDQGHRSLSNEPAAFDLNHKLVSKQFQLAFHVDDEYPVTLDAPRFALPRFEVLRTFTGKDLVRQLKVIDPAVSTSRALAGLDIDAGRYSDALDILARLEHDGAIEKSDLLTTRGKVLTWSGDHAGAREQFEQAIALRPGDPVVQQELAALDLLRRPLAQFSGLYFQDNAHRTYFSLGPSAQLHLTDGLSLSAYYKYLDFDQVLDSRQVATLANGQHFHTIGHQFEGQIRYELGPRSSLSLSAGAADFSGHASSPPLKSGSTFPLGSAKLETGIGDRLDLSLGVDHTYVNTAAAIMNDITYTRVLGGFKAKVTDSVSVGANHAYTQYNDHNQRNRTEVNIAAQVWRDPNITVGAQFVRDDTENKSALFWTPNNYVAVSAPVSIKTKLTDKVIAELSAAPGMGKEAREKFKFQINSTGVLQWNVSDAVSLNVSAGQYQAATYSNFGAFAGISVRF